MKFGRGWSLRLVAAFLAATCLYADGSPGCGNIVYRTEIGSCWNCWYPPICAYNYLAIPARAASYRHPITELQLWRRLLAIGFGAVPVMTAPPPQGLREGLTDALNVRFLMEGLQTRELKVTLIRQEMIGTGASQYREQEILIEDPYVGTFKGILLTPPNAGQYPGVVALHGHSETAEAYRDLYGGAEYPRNGVILLVLTSRVMEPWIMEHYVTESLLLDGFNLIGIRAYEAMLALRILGCHPNVRPTARGLIGHSGGSSAGNLVARLAAPEMLGGYVSDYKINYFMLPSLEPYHCETAHQVYPYHRLVNDFSTLPIPVMEVEYGYGGKIGDIINFFKSLP